MNMAAFLYLCVLALALLCSYIGTLDVKVGHIGYENASIAQALVELAVERLHSTKTLPIDVTFSYYGRGLNPCNSYAAIAKAVDLYINESVNVFIGLTCDSAVAPVASFAVYYNVPVINYLATTPDLADKNLYKTLIRVFPTQDNLGNAIKGIMRTFRWQRAALIRMNTKTGGCDLFESAMRTLSDKGDLNLVVDVQVTRQNDTAALEAVLLKIRNSARIVFICLIWELYSSLVTTRDILMKAHELNMTGSEYVYIVPNLYNTIGYVEDIWIAFPPDGKDDIARKAYQSVVQLEPATQQVSEVDALQGKLREKLPWVSSYLHGNITEYNFTLIWPYQYLHDAIVLYGMALNRSFASNGRYDLTGRNMLTNARCLSFKSYSGLLQMNSNAERIDTYVLSRMDENETSFTPFAAIRANQTLICTKNLTVYEYDQLRDPVWRTSDGKAPLDIPVCGYQEEHCQPSSLWSSILFYMAMFLLVAAVAWLAWWFRRWRYERELLRKSWQINLNHLRIFDPENLQASTLGSTRSLYESAFGRSNMSIRSDTNQPTIPLVKASANGTQAFEGLGQYENIIVVVKIYPKLRSWMFKRMDLVRLKAIKDARHDNLNLFIGANVDDELTSSFTLIWRHCSRGTLEDVLYNDEIHLDMMFKASMMRDIIEGLEYLHRHRTTIGYHGALRSDTCVVDSRWMVKLTDFGLQSVIHHLVQSGCVSGGEGIDKHLYGVAPEVLRDLDLGIMRPTPQADVYSFGMVLYQILSRSSLFENESISSSEILNRIKNTRYLTPFRPEIAERSPEYDALFDVVRICWQESPLDRPTVSAVRTAIHRLTKPYHKNLMDHMVTMLEKYATNLEKIVDERTRDLDEQRKRADTLLSQLLPKSVANCLKAGQPVPAESYDSVTVYFSDIVGFTTLCSISHPMDVVNMLNQLYTDTDAIISSFDAYKVETIGDAYLVVSGLPERNGIRHVQEIANMSLKIRSFVRTFTISHLPKKRLEVRIGVHTGPVAAGVVGVIMPRYCLFGDTVNVASRMESTGEPMKIQISQHTRDLLLKYNRYILQPRGRIEIKGKGMCETFWLDETPLGPMIC